MTATEVPTEQVWTDLKENDAELRELKRTRSRTTAHDRISSMKIRALSSQIDEHIKLSKKLRRILKDRGEDVMV